MNSKININRSNYELFVIDYLDDNLSQDELQCLFSFLNDNPDIKEEVSELKTVKLSVDKETYINKDNLKKNIIVPCDGINETSYEDFFIAYYENDLTSEQRSSVKQFLKLNPNLENEFIIHGNLKLSDDKSVVFDNKESIKKRRSVIPVMSSVAAAATILILISLWHLLDRDTNNINVELAYINQIAPKQSKKLILNKGTVANLYEYKNDIVQVIDEQFVEEIEVSRTSTTISELSIIQESLTFNKGSEDKAIIEKINDLPVTDLATITHTVGGDGESVKEKKPGIVSSIINNQVNKLASVFKRDKKKKRNSTSPDPTYVKIIDKGILVFNTITGSETYTSKTYDTSGELTSFKVEGKEVLLNKNSREKSSP